MSTANSSSARSGEPVAGPDSAGRQLAALTAELQQRDLLIETLTERLEEAAEQLDRFHRSGADRQLRNAPSAGGGGGSAEFLERHGELFQRMEGLVADWEEVQGGALLHRLDIRLDKLIEILRGEEGSSGSPVPTPPQVTGSPAQYQDAQPAEESVAEGPSTGESQGSQTRDLPELQSPPAPIAEDEHNTATLHAAITERDDYISYLIRELRCQQPRTAINWEALQACPAELEASLRMLEKQLKSEIQREDLALSLERAKLARERAELDRIRSRLEKEIRQFGQAQQKEAAAESAAESEEPGRSSWRLFGKRS